MKNRPGARTGPRTRVYPTTVLVPEQEVFTLAGFLIVEVWKGEGTA